MSCTVMSLLKAVLYNKFNSIDLKTTTLYYKLATYKRSAVLLTLTVKLVTLSYLAEETLEETKVSQVKNKN